MARDPTKAAFGNPGAVHLGGDPGLGFLRRLRVGSRFTRPAKPSPART